MDDRTAQRAVDAIIENLMGRKGLGNEWDEIDEDIRLEIRSEWVGLVKTAEGQHEERD